MLKCVCRGFGIRMGKFCKWEVLRGGGERTSRGCLGFLDILRCSFLLPQDIEFNKLITQLDICLCIAPRDQMLKNNVKLLHLIREKAPSAESDSS